MLGLVWFQFKSQNPAKIHFILIETSVILVVSLATATVLQKQKIVQLDYLDFLAKQEFLVKMVILDRQAVQEYQVPHQKFRMVEMDAF